jgi:hypothetical protein
LEGKRKDRDKGSKVAKRDRNSSEGSLAQVIEQWAETCFPVGSQTTEAELIGPEEAVAWAEEYKFPPDLLCLQPAFIQSIERARLVLVAAVPQVLHRL